MRNSPPNKRLKPRLSDKVGKVAATKTTARTKHSPKSLPIKLAISPKNKAQSNEWSGDTEARILQAARQEFLNRGLSGARMRSIAASAGVNAALPNYYFRSKEALYAAALRDTLQKVWGELKQAALSLSPDASFEELIREFLARYFALLTQHPEFPRFMMRELIDGGVHLVDAIQEVKQGFTQIPQLIFSSIKREVAQGKMRAVDPIHIGLNVAGMALITILFQTLAPKLEAQVGFDLPKGQVFLQSRIDSIVSTLLYGLRTSV